MTFSVESAVDSYVLANASIREPDQLWHPSSVFACDRKAIYEYRGTESSNPRTNRSHRVLHIGSRWHEIVQAAILDHGGADEVYTEVPISIPSLKVVGHADQIVRIGDRWELIEIKSISSRGFQYLKGAKPEHIQQAMTYLYALRVYGSPCPIDEAHECDPVFIQGCRKAIPPLGDALDRIRLCYISKDDLRVGEYVVHWDPAFESELRIKVATLQSYADDPLSLPPRLPLEKGKKNWLCESYCELRDRCWNTDPVEVAPAPDVW